MPEAETRFQHSLLTNDVAALDQFVHNDARFTGPHGLTIDKATDMADHRSHALTLTVVDELDREVQVIDGVGITRTTLHLVGAAGDQALDIGCIQEPNTGRITVPSPKSLRGSSGLPLGCAYRFP